MPARAVSPIVACIPHLRRYARGLLRDSDQADDLVQDTLERAWAKYAMWQESRGELRVWLFSIMHNLFIDRLRSQHNRREDAWDEQTPEMADHRQPGDNLGLRDLDRLLQRLPEPQREVLLLVTVEGLSYQEVADVLVVPVGTVMSRLSRARERLRAEVEGRSVEPRLQRVQ